VQEIEARLAHCRRFEDLIEVARDLGLGPSLEAPASKLASHAEQSFGVEEELAPVFDEFHGWSVAELLQDGRRLLRGRVKTTLFEAAKRYLASSVPIEPEPVGEDGPPKEPMGLRAWARARGIEPLLERDVYSLVGNRVPYSMGTALLRCGTVLALLTRVEDGPREVNDLRRAVRAQLEEEAKKVAIELEGERRWLERPLPEDPTDRALGERLRQLRAKLRETLPPRAPKKVRLELALDPDGEPVVRHAPIGWKVGLETRLDLSLENEAPLGAQCGCNKTGRCAHVLDVVDALLGELLDHTSCEWWRALARAASTPAWQRALALVDRSVNEARAAEAENEGAVLWWRIEPDLAIQPLVQERGRRGPLKPRAKDPSVLLEGALDLPSEDRELLALSSALLAARSTGGKRRPRPVLAALRRLVGHPRVLLASGAQASVTRGAIELSVGAEGDRLTLLPRLDGHPVSAGELIERLQQDSVGDALVEIDEERARCVITEVPKEIRRAAGALRALSRGVPRAHGEELLRRLAAVGSRTPVTLDRSLAANELRPEKRIVLRLTPGEPAALKVQAFLRPLHGGPLVHPGQGPEVLVAATEERDLVFTRREIREEPGWALERLRALLPGVERSWSVTIEAIDEALELVDRLSRAEEIDCEWPSDGAWQVSRGALPSDLRVRLRDRADWFGLEGEVEVEGARVSIAALLEAARERRRFVRVDQRRWLAIGESLRRRMELLEPYVVSSPSGLQISPAFANEVESAAADAAEIVRPPRWSEILERLERAARLEPRLPEGLRAELRPYQVEGFAWLSRLAACGLGACLADDMGLGKTVQAIALLLDRESKGPALVVAPTSVTFNWVREIRAFAPELNPILYREAGREEALERAGPGDVVIASYGLLARDFVEEKTRFATFVLDEAQAIKNAGSQRAKAARAVDAEWTVALTGTPIENHLGELWSIFHVLSPAVLGSWEQFRERFAAPIERDRDPYRARVLSRTLRPFVLRRTKAEVAAELPPRTDVRVDVILSPKERALYEDARLAAVAKLANLEVGLPAEKQRFWVLAALTRLRQIASHPRLLDPNSTVPSSKMVALLDLVRSILEAGQRALVFSSFTQHLALVRETLDAAGISYLYLDGGTPHHDRAPLVDAFQAGERALFLISLKAGGTGLNLTAADNVILLDPWWNPAAEDQAADRAHRIGQTRPVTVYRLVSLGTIEESILDLHSSKRALVDAVLDGTGAAGAISTAELIDLIRSGGAVAADDEPEEALEGPPAESPTPMANVIPLRPLAGAKPE
jgi:hypothetical protein